MSEWDTFDAPDGGPYHDDHYQDDSFPDDHYQGAASEGDSYQDDPYHSGPGDPAPDHGGPDHGGPDLGVPDHGPAGATLAAAPEFGGHDPHDPLLNDPLTGHDPLSAEPDWIYDPALGGGAPGLGATADGLLGGEPSDQWDSVVAPEVVSGDPFTELINESEPIEPGTPLWDTVMNVLALPGQGGDGWLQPGADDLGMSV